MCVMYCVMASNVFCRTCDYLLCLKVASKEGFMTKLGGFVKVMRHIMQHSVQYIHSL